MQEITSQFEEEYTELLSRYKERLTNVQIMSILQSVTRKLIGIKDNPVIDKANCDASIDLESSMMHLMH